MRRAVIAWLGLLAACRPSFDETVSLVTRPRLLAVRGEPAEVAPNGGFTLTALVASPGGTVADPAVAWAFCRVPKPLAENDVVSAGCLADDGVAMFGAGASVTTTMPGDACALFGSDAPPQTSGQPPQRPRDPDATGGYFQPVRASFAGTPSFQLARVTCSLANASVDVATAFHMSYTPNRNPALTPLVAGVDGKPAALDALPAGKRVTFTTGWPQDSVETFPVLDVLSQSLVTHREAMRLSWFASAGTFDSDATGRGERDLATSTTNGWLAPSTPGPAHLWLVLHDSRGGTAFAGYDVGVR